MIILIYTQLTISSNKRTLKSIQNLVIPFFISSCRLMTAYRSLLPDEFSVSAGLAMVASLIFGKTDSLIFSFVALQWLRVIYDNTYRQRCLCIGGRVACEPMYVPEGGWRCDPTFGGCIGGRVAKCTGAKVTTAHPSDLLIEVHIRAGD